MTEQALSINPQTFQIIVLRRAIKLYAETGMKANTAYTPKNMRLTAERLTGKKFKSRDFAGMQAALTELLP
jgi:ribosomal protein L33